MNCWFGAGCLILSNCFEMAGKKSMSSFAVRAEISLPIALFSCPHSLHYFVLRLHLAFVKRSLLYRLQSETAACVLCMSPLASSSFCKKWFNPCVIYLDRRQGRSLRYLFHRCLCFMPRSPRTWTWSQPCWCGLLWVHNANQQFCALCFLNSGFKALRPAFMTNNFRKKQ